MIKPTAMFILLTASLLLLLLWATQVSGEPLTTEQYRAQSSGSNFNIGHSSGLLQQIRTRMSSLGLSMPGRLGGESSQSQYGEAPAWDAETAPSVTQQAVPPILAVPVDLPQSNGQPSNGYAPNGQPSIGYVPSDSLPNGFMGDVVTLNTYHHPAPPMAVGPYPQGHAPSAQGTIPEQRIVYVPYASPPPIYVERLGKALPRPPVMRRVLGDANMYEYPEMPMRTYTTRGPRDFFAPNPSGIGY